MTRFPWPAVFHLATPKTVLIERISPRRQCPQCGRIDTLQAPETCDVEGAKLVRRADDSVEVLTARLEVYQRQTVRIMAHDVR